ncbi:MAG: iron-sulfur cluster assembly scaffold protein [Kiritimatiellae bacterium]|nr:iron-sulfur cluster assembly scaffold protein [Kiritimatiellia bacterium]
MSWDYTQKTKDLFLAAVQGREGTHLGEIASPDGVGEHGSIVCGDALKLTFRVEKAANPLDDVIVEAKYLTFGCTSAIAASEALCTILESRRLTPIQALSVTNADIVDFLGGLPQQKIHCSVMGADALEAAVFDWAQRRGVDLAAAGVKRGEEKLAEDEGRIVCKCFAVTEPYLRRRIQELSLHTVEEVTNALKAGGMCGACRYAPGGIQDILNDIWGAEAAAVAAPAAPAAAAESPFRRAQRINEALESVRGNLRADGGNVELVDVKGNKVFVRLTGACATCPGAQGTLAALVEKTLRERIDPTVDVIRV